VGGELYKYNSRKLRCRLKGGRGVPKGLGSHCREETRKKTREKEKVGLTKNDRYRNGPASNRKYSWTQAKKPAWANLVLTCRTQNLCVHTTLVCWGSVFSKGNVVGAKSNKNTGNKAPKSQRPRVLKLAFTGKVKKNRRAQKIRQKRR